MIYALGYSLDDISMAPSSSEVTLLASDVDSGSLRRRLTELGWGLYEDFDAVEHARGAVLFPYAYVRVLRGAESGEAWSLATDGRGGGPADSSYFVAGRPLGASGVARVDRVEFVELTGDDARRCGLE